MIFGEAYSSVGRVVRRYGGPHQCRRRPESLAMVSPEPVVVAGEQMR